MPGMDTSRAIFILVLVGLTMIVAIALNSSGPQEVPGSRNGTLTGNVTIGPLCPVEPCTLPHDRLVAAYAAWPIRVSTPGGTAVSSVIADPGTGYTISLKPGTYIIEIPHPGIGGSRELPATVTIRGGENVRLNISVDTGIR